MFSAIVCEPRSRLGLEIRIVGAELLARPRLDERPQARDLVGQGDGELLRLGEQQRHEEDERDDDDAGEGGDDERCGDAARHAPLRQPVGGRVHEVGDDDAGDERQDDAAQQRDEQDEHQRGRQPEQHLTFDAHRFQPQSTATAQRHAQPRASGDSLPDICSSQLCK